MDFKNIIEQSELAKQAVEQIKNQTRTFEQTLNGVVEHAPDDQKAELDAIRVMSIKALNLAKQGKGKEAEQLIKDFQDGRKNKK